MTYAAMSHFAQTWGMIYFLAMFAAAYAYALWPANRGAFRRAADLPLQKTDEDDDRPLA
jgi:cytochrome c oxidase cbb3-type subunit 4